MVLCIAGLGERVDLAVVVDKFNSDEKYFSATYGCISEFPFSSQKLWSNIVKYSQSYYKLHEMNYLRLVRNMSSMRLLSLGPIRKFVFRSNVETWFSEHWFVSCDVCNSWPWLLALYPLLKALFLRIIPSSFSCQMPWACSGKYPSPCILILPSLINLHLLTFAIDLEPESSDSLCSVLGDI